MQIREPPRFVAYIFYRRADCAARTRDLRFFVFGIGVGRFGHGNLCGNFVFFVGGVNGDCGYNRRFFYIYQSEVVREEKQKHYENGGNDEFSAQVLHFSLLLLRK